MMQNPHCSSRPEPRQVAANSFTQSIASSALNSALQTSTTAFITSLPAIYSFTIQPLFKKCQSHHLIQNMRHLETLCTEGWTIFAYIAQTAVKIKTRMQNLESRLGCHKERLQVINIPFEYKQASHTVVSKSKTIFKCTHWILVILIQYV